MVDDSAILDAVTDFYLESGDFNGLPVREIVRRLSLDLETLKAATRRLVAADEVEVLFGNVHSNPHIKAFPTLPVADQLSFLDTLDFGGHVCLYPTTSRLARTPLGERFQDRPFELELARGAGQLEFRAFDLSVLEHYRNDPRYYYETNFIGGSICVRDEFFESESMPEHDQVLLQTFGFAYDSDLNRAVAVFLRYLAKLSPEHQRTWHAKLLKGEYKLHPDYYRSSILGDWGTRMSIFDAFTEELAVINAMCALMGRPNLFKDAFSDRPNEFGFLLRPTLGEFNAFVLLLDKMLSDNINKDFFEQDVPLEEDTTREDGKIVVRQKGTLALLQEWFGKFFHPADPAPIERMFKSLRTVRKLRQKPAHAVNENVFDLKYFKEQRQLVIDAYEAVRTLRLSFANHPRVRRNPPNMSRNLADGEIWDI